jgi:hypothetical protein
VVVIATAMIGKLHRIVRFTLTVVAIVVASVNVCKVGVYVGFMVAAFAGQGHNIASRQYRNV